jgi:hemoglobin
MMRKPVKVLAFGTILFFTCTLALSLLQAQQTNPKSLYQRLGGYDAISNFVDTAFPRVASHPKLERFFKGHSTDSQYRQRQLIIELLCRETGGTCVYTGRAMKNVHVGLQITEEDWKIFIDVISGALKDLKVPKAEKDELLTLFEKRFKPDVVEKL